jgi:glycosyltransferase A (GT-A) superfamily protein (DUF2064 family)
LFANTAILLFSRSAKAEAVHKNFISYGNKNLNRKVANALIKNSKKVAEASNLPVHIITEHQQLGFTFGEKISNAIEKVFNVGYQNLVIIGSDCPQLSLMNIQKAAVALNRNEFVLGPDNKGGVYLIGISRDQFNKQLFQNQPWKTASLYEALSSYACTNTVNVFTLPALHDVNSSVDLKPAFVFLPAYHKLKLTYLSIIASIDILIEYSLFLLQKPLIVKSKLRGPPPTIS